MRLQNRGIVVGLSCLRCGKTLRNDYNGLCMDCVDVLGLSEFMPEKSVEQIKKIVIEDNQKQKWHFLELFKRAKIDAIFIVMGLIKPYKTTIWRDEIKKHYKIGEQNAEI